jgi:hypothetical protein
MMFYKIGIPRLIIFSGAVSILVKIGRAGVAKRIVEDDAQCLMFWCLIDSR